MMGGLSGLERQLALIGYGLLTLALLDFAWLCGPERPQLDDAYISYRYASNWVAGHGLVWNPGEYVEGFTNPLWTAAIALGLALGGEARPLGHALGLLSGLATLCATLALARAWLPTGRSALAAWSVLPVATSVSFLDWTTAGLETPLVAALGTFALVASARERHGLALGLLVLTTLTRMDSALLALPVLGAPLLSCDLRRLASWRNVALFAAFLVLVTAARLLYYGSPLPNTFYAKVGDVPMAFGLLYVEAFLKSGAVFLLPLAALGLAGDRRRWPTALWMLVLTAYVVRVGGDAFPNGRFLLPLLPALSAAAVAGLVLAFEHDRRIGLVLAPLLPLACVWQIFHDLPGALGVAMALPWIAVALHGRLPGRALVLGAAVIGALLVVAAAGGPRGVAWTLRDSARDRELARVWRLAEHGERTQSARAARLRALDGEPLLAAGAIGVLGFESRLPIIDILGLTDAHIARSRAQEQPMGLPIPGHSRSDASYVMRRAPDFIFIPRRGQGPGLVPALHALWNHPELESSYVWDTELAGYRRRVADRGR